jgi:hypothetical protein
VSADEQSAFLDAVDRLPSLAPAELARLTFTVDPAQFRPTGKAGIFKE